MIGGQAVATQFPDGPYYPFVGKAWDSVANAETNIGFGGPNIITNWEADSDNRWTIPVGLAVNTTTKIGPLPVKVGIEVYKYIKQPDQFGAEWGLRLIFSPVVPKPAFSKRPIFGN